MGVGKQPSWLNRIWLIVILLAGIVIAVQYLIRRLKPSVKEERAEIGDSPGDQDIPYRIMGLTKEEAAARQGDFNLEAEICKDDRRFLRSAIRQSLISTYNIDLFGIALILHLLGNPLAAIGTLLLVTLNLVLNVFQHMYTRRKLNQILKELRPQAAVIRDGQLHSIEPVLIVEGDYLVARAGDEFLVDGQLVSNKQILVEQINTAGNAHQIVKNPGDEVIAGSYCLEGHSIYRSSEAGTRRYQAGPGKRLQLLLGELTPLQRFMELIFRILFGLVLLISVLLIADALITGRDLVSTAYQDAFSILFGIAPTSLFFILIVTYAIGTVRISERGALVYEARSIETLADTSLLCISEESLVSGLQVDLELVTPPVGVEPFSENLVRRILGDFIHSIPILSPADQMLTQALPGESQSSIETAPFLSTYGWHAATFSKPDMPGTLVLGLAEVMEDHLQQDKAEFFETTERSLNKIWHGVSSWIKRSRSPEHEDGEQQSIKRSNRKDIGIDRFVSGSKKGKKPGRQNWMDRLDRLLSPMEDQTYFQARGKEKTPDIRLTFAYLPAPARIYDHQNKPLLPDSLIPISHVGISAILRPEGGQTIRDLVEAGLKVKLLSAEAPEEAARTALDLDLPGEQLRLVSGTSLEKLDQREFNRLIHKGNVLGDLTPSSKAAIIDKLRQTGEKVLMVGNSVADIPAMQMANLRMALRNSAQASLKLTDIVLLKDSLAALPHVLITGQRLVNGVLDLFKLYLSQIIAQLLLVLIVALFGYAHFPYHPTQAGIISLFTIAIPAMFLSVWAAAGRVTETGIRRQLAHFIIPSAITIALLTWVVYAFFISRYQNEEYAQLAVTCSLLVAGWLRVLFVQPPAPFWVGGAPLRGDRRVVAVVLGSVLLFFLIILMPFFQEIMRITWLRSVDDYLFVILAAWVWGIITRTIWRSRWLERLINKI